MLTENGDVMVSDELKTTAGASARAPSDELRFEFGKNWSRFLSLLDDERIREAEESLKNMLGVESLAGRSFLDIGSGSGLFSLAARRLGARVHSFDYDPHSVACTKELRRRYFASDDESAWRVEQASALDADYVSSLGTFDVVYSWGVLHHTGDMWRGLENAHRAVAPGEAKALLRALLLLRPLEYVRGWTEYKSRRGMSRRHDIVDWVGGYPYGVAAPEEIFDFYRDRGFRLQRIKCGGVGRGCNEFVFVKE